MNKTASTDEAELRSTVRFLGTGKAFIDLLLEALLAEAKAIGEVLDLSQVVLVLPGSRVARILEQKLYERTAGRIILPQTATVSTLPQLLSCHPLAIATELDELVALYQVLSGLGAQEYSDLGFSERLLKNENALVSAAQDLIATFKELGSHGVSPEQVLASLQEHFDGLDLPRWSVIFECHQRWKDSLKTSGKIPFDAYRQEANLLPAFSQGMPDSASRKVFVAGLAIINPATEALLARLPAVSYWIFSEREHAAGFSETGRIRKEFWLEQELSLLEAQVSFLQSSADYGVAIADELTRVQPGATSIALGNEKEASLLAQGLKEFELPIHRSAGISLGECSLGRAMLQLLDFNSAPTITLARELLLNDSVHPHLEGRYNGYLEQMAKFRSCSTTDSLKGAADPLLVSILEQLNKLGDQVLKGEKHLATANASAREFLQTQEVSEIVHELILTVNAQNLGGGTSRLMLKNQLGKLTVPDLQNQNALEILGWLELAFDDAPNACVLGLTANVVPAPLTNCQFLPESLRQKLGLETFDDRRARDRYLLHTLLKTKASIKFLCPLADGEHNPLRPSELLFCCSTAEQISRLGKMEQPLEWRSPALLNENSRESMLKGFLPRAGVEVPKSYSVTQLETYLRDPYEFYLRYVEGIKSHAEPVEASPLMVGMILHDLLNTFANSAYRDSKSQKEIFSFLEQALWPSMYKHCLGTPSQAVLVQYELLLERLKRFAAFQARHSSAGWQIVDSEITIHAQSLPFVIEGKTFFLHGRIDRLDKHVQTGETLLLDFKTNEKARTALAFHKTKKGFQKLQLPFYDLLLELQGRRPSRKAFVFISAGQEELEIAELENDNAFDAEARATIVACLKSIQERAFWPPKGASIDEDFAWITALGEEFA